jgi:acyl-coenzyme A synthetase/AMP-(fatty) acid ligase
VVLSVAASIAGIALSPLSARISPTLAMNLFEQIQARGLVLEGALLDDTAWRDALAVLRQRLSGRPILIQGEACADARVSDLPTLEQASLSGNAISPRARDPNRVSLLLSTGGSTGTPKSVMHSENTLIYAARRFAAATGFTGDDVHVAFGPYGHASGSVFEIYMPLLHGATILPNARWRAQPVVEAIARWQGSYCITVGTHVFDLLALEKGVEPMLESLRLIVSGAGPDQLFVDAEQRFGVRIVRDYGMTECLGHAPGRPDDHASVRLHKDGVPFPGIEYRIRDPQSGERAAQGKPGEYVVRGPSMFMGYYGQPELTAAAITDDGFYRTGDLMTETADGYITWAGRMKDIIRRGGLQVDVIELENLLVQHADLAACAVVGEPHPRLGEEIVIVAVLKKGHPHPTLDDLVRYLAARGLPKECLPRKLAYAAELPVTEWGKYNRVEIRKWLASQSAAQA